MKKTLIISTLNVIAIWFCIEAVAQNLTWDNNYHFTGRDDGYFMKAIRSSENEIYLAGYAEFDWYQYCPGFMKIDTNGTKIGDKTFDFPGSYQMITQTLAKLSENGYYSFCFNPLLDVITEHNDQKDEITNDCYLMKLNNNGDTIFSIHVDDIGWVNDLIIDDGKLIAAGSTNYWEEIGFYTYYYTKTTLMALDTNGVLLWRQEYLTDLDSRANSILRTEEGNYLLTGTTTNTFDHFGYINFPDQMFLIQTDQNGNLLSEYLSDIEYSEGKKIIAVTGDHIVIAGDGYYSPENNRDIILWKFDADLSLISTVFSGLPKADEVYSIRQTPDLGFIISGEIIPLSSTNWTPAFFFMKTDSEGNIEWQKNNEMGNSCAKDVLINNSTGYFFAGYNASDAQLVKTDLQGNGLIVSSEKSNIENLFHKVQIDPNPANDRINVHLPLLYSVKQKTIMLMDNAGRSVEIINDIYGQNVVISVGDFDPGIYFLRVFIEGGQTLCEKFVVIK